MIVARIVVPSVARTTVHARIADPVRMPPGPNSNRGHNSRRRSPVHPMARLNPVARRVAKVAAVGVVADGAAAQEANNVRVSSRDARARIVRRMNVRREARHGKSMATWRNALPCPSGNGRRRPNVHARK